MWRLSERNRKDSWCRHVAGTWENSIVSSRYLPGAGVLPHARDGFPSFTPASRPAYAPRSSQSAEDVPKASIGWRRASPGAASSTQSQIQTAGLVPSAARSQALMHSLSTCAVLFLLHIPSSFPVSAWAPCPSTPDL